MRSVLIWTPLLLLAGCTRSPLALKARNRDSITAHYWLAHVEEIQGNHKAGGAMAASAPEPASMVLLGTVLLGCVAIARRRVV